MSTPRRSFLRQLACLPLIGGGVSLIGNPTSVAEPTTEDLLYTYVSFLAHEHSQAYFAWEKVRDGGGYDPMPGRKPHDAPMFWFPEHKGVAEVVSTVPAERRAALVLSAAGCDWREKNR